MQFFFLPASSSTQTARRPPPTPLLPSHFSSEDRAGALGAIEICEMLWYHVKSSVVGPARCGESCTLHTQHARTRTGLCPHTHRCTDNPLTSFGANEIACPHSSTHSQCSADAGLTHCLQEHILPSILLLRPRPAHAGNAHSSRRPRLCPVLKCVKQSCVCWPSLSVSACAIMQRRHDASIGHWVLACTCNHARQT